MTQMMLPRRSEHTVRFLPGSASASTTASPRPAPSLPRIIVASRGGHGDPALRLASALARRHGADVEILTVHEPRIPIPEEWRTTAATRFEKVDRPRAAQLLVRVRSQRRAESPEPCRWPVRLEVGDPPRVIARTAAEEGADLIVVGIGRESPTDRVRGSQTAVRLAHLATVPMLAVPPDVRTLPRRALVVGPCPTTEALGARAAAALLQDDGELLLARPGAPARPGDRPEAASWETEIERGVRRVPLADASAEEVLHAAERLDADLIVTTIAGGDYKHRVMAPGLAVPLLRQSRCSVLVVPVDAAVRATNVSTHTHTREPARAAPPFLATGE